MVCCMSLQKSKSLNFPTKTVEIPSTDVIPYLMYKTMRGALVDLKDSLDESLEKEFSRISNKGRSLTEDCSNNFVFRNYYLQVKLTLKFVFPLLALSLKEASNKRSSEKTKGKVFLSLKF